jgi:hypothetical protein
VTPKDALSSVIPTTKSYVTILTILTLYLKSRYNNEDEAIAKNKDTSAAACPAWSLWAKVLIRMPRTRHGHSNRQPQINQKDIGGILKTPLWWFLWQI